MALGRKPPRSDHEIIADAEQEAAEWARWLKQYIDTGIGWILEERYGEVKTKRHKRTLYHIFATRGGVEISIWCNIGSRIADQLKKMDYKVSHRCSHGSSGLKNVFH